VIDDGNDGLFAVLPMGLWSGRSSGFGMSSWNAAALLGGVSDCAFGEVGVRGTVGGSKVHV